MTRKKLINLLNNESIQYIQFIIDAKETTTTTTTKVKFTEAYLQDRRFFFKKKLVRKHMKKFLMKILNHNCFFSKFVFNFFFFLTFIYRDMFDYSFLHCRVERQAHAQQPLSIQQDLSNVCA
jgi:hypothetical protein